jgi:hypothetical protein
VTADIPALLLASLIIMGSPGLSTISLAADNRALAAVLVDTTLAPLLR